MHAASLLKWTYDAHCIMERNPGTFPGYDKSSILRIAIISPANGKARRDMTVRAIYTAWTKIQVSGKKGSVSIQR